MKCSACANGTLTASYLEGLFPCHTCSQCSGNLIMLGDYLRWKDQNPDTQLSSEQSIEIDVEETSKAMICPKTGRLMTKYKISKDTNHRLDLSPTINAIWLDEGEWELLKANGLAHRLNNIFTYHFQQEINDQASEEMIKALQQRKFGAHYERLLEFREFLNTMENRSEAIAFLLSEDPLDS